MDEKELKKKINETSNIIDIFIDENTFWNFEGEPSDLIREYLNEAQIMDIIYNYRSNINNFLKCFIENLSEANKIKVLLNPDISSNINKNDAMTIIEGLSDESKKEILSKNDIIIRLFKFNPREIVNLINEIESETYRIDVIKIYQKSKYKLSIELLKIIFDKVSDDIKLEMLLDPEIISMELLEKKHVYISINPENFSKEQRAKFIELCRKSPKLDVVNFAPNVIFEGEIQQCRCYSTAEEYAKAEEWIESVIKKIKPKHTSMHKLAIIDNEIGKRISYSPDFETDVFKMNDSRAMWKIISSGYGTCSGIAKIENYILTRVGIQSEVVCSAMHAFLKVKNMGYVFKNGQLELAHTIVDPTYNLDYHRFGAEPHCFCVSYERIREQVPCREYGGKLIHPHENDKELSDATYSLPEYERRKVFHKVGAASQTGEYPIKEIMDRSATLHQIYKDNPEANLEKQFSLLYEVYPDFAIGIHSSITMLSDIFIKYGSLRFDRCVLNRVYDKEDREKRPFLYMYITSEKLGSRFYYADKEQGRFIQLSQEEFEKRFACYEKDLDELNGIKPWETVTKNDNNISKSHIPGTREVDR